MLLLSCTYFIHRKKKQFFETFHILLPHKQLIKLVSVIRIIRKFCVCSCFHNIIHPCIQLSFNLTSMGQYRRMKIKPIQTMCINTQSILRTLPLLRHTTILVQCIFAKKGRNLEVSRSKAKLLGKSSLQLP